MMFHPKNLTPIPGKLCLSGEVHATAHPCLSKPVILELWHSFSWECSSLSVTACDALVFSVGSAPTPPLNGCDYSMYIGTDGICIHAKTEQELVRGFVTLLDRFQAVERDGTLAVELACCRIEDTPTIRERMVHVCVFPETELWELQRFIRLCGVLKYTHIVLEFWGTVQYTCMKELSWQMAYTKEQIAPLIEEAQSLGLEVTPMFNHWGHAAASRGMHGKHVVLDQNPSRQTYFTEDGWCWAIRKPKVRELLRQIRGELMELCGDGRYFHIGCDEAFGFDFSEESMTLICDYINGITEELAAHNRRAIVWGDMFLCHQPHYNAANTYTCNAPSVEAQRFLLEHLDRRAIIADWQYEAPHAPVETAAVFKHAGFDCLLCPWDRGKDTVHAAITTVGEQALMGFMHTTWHTLTCGMPYVALSAAWGYDGVDGRTMQQMYASAAAHYRRVMPVAGDYTKAGWSKIQVHSLW